MHPCHLKIVWHSLWIYALCHGYNTLHIQRYTQLTFPLQFNLGLCFRRRDLGLNLLRTLVYRPSGLVISRLVDDDGDVTDQPLLQDTAEELNVKHGLVATDLRVLENVERVDPVSGPASAGQVLDGVGNVWPELKAIRSVGDKEA